MGSEADIPLDVPLASPGVPGVAFPAVVDTEVDPETGERRLRDLDD